jgi:hypothetical protein
LSDVFREVDEELRKDKLRELWGKYGLYAIAVAVLIVVAVAGDRLYRSWVDARAGESGAKLSRALTLHDQSDAAGAVPLLEELRTDGHGSYPILATMQRAAALAEAGEREAAVALYDEVAEDGGADDMLRGLARIRAGLLVVDTAPEAEIEDRVGAFAADETGTWRHSARELLALAAYHHGGFAAADAQYDRIMTDPATPAGLRGRAEMMRALIAPHLAAGAK